MDRARTCFKAASAIDASATAVSLTLRELETGPAANGDLERDEHVLSALHEAEAALTRARDAVQAALKARQLTAANREPVYGLVG